MCKSWCTAAWPHLTNKVWIHVCFFTKHVSLLLDHLLPAAVCMRKIRRLGIVTRGNSSHSPVPEPFKRVTRICFSAWLFRKPLTLWSMAIKLCAGLRSSPCANEGRVHVACWSRSCRECFEHELGCLGPPHLVRTLPVNKCAGPPILLFRSRRLTQYAGEMAQ